ncbi:zinc finger protein HD1-like isoform X2 [Salvia miltiorrhiza]|uniref:zinc finger protein HD1-like isoform X2 n=2 Tax=Salvia miltiorrhiza TaxID=226208 RepID=UPI0025ACEC68|nr:zinc finger protein HD1-like isoform X2 [Salvia miltiorrhiza]
MLQEMVHPQDQQLSIEEFSNPNIGSHLLEFSESELFPETVQNSEVGSNTYDHEKQSSYQIQLSNITVEMSNFNTSTNIDDEIKPPPPPPPIVAAAGTLFDEENDISAAIDFTTSPSFSHHQYISNNSSSNNNNNNIDNNNDNDASQEAFDISSLNGQLDMTAASGWAAAGPYEEECMSSFMRMKASQPLIDSIMVPYLGPPPGIPFTTSTQSSGAFMGMQDLEFQGDNAAFFIPDNMQRAFNCPTDLQGLSNESQHLYHGGATTTTTSSLASEISSLEDPTFKVGKLSVEERKRKIHRYMKKRNERNFSKKIKYACRKTLADSRPRVRGRFAKNDELGEVGRHMGNNHEDDVDEDGLYSNSIPRDHQRKVVVKEEDELDSSDILAHISGVNSFKCNYPIQSWI